MKSPFTQEQCDRLNEHQRNRQFHPFTCGSGNRRDAAHKAYRAEHGGDYGQLVATPAGWICPVPGCGYTQGWAHGCMVDPPTGRPPLAERNDNESSRNA